MIAHPKIEESDLVCGVGFPPDNQSWKVIQPGKEWFDLPTTPSFLPFRIVPLGFCGPGYRFGELSKLRPQFRSAVIR